MSGLLPTQHDAEEDDSVLAGPWGDAPAPGDGHGSGHEAAGLAQSELGLIRITSLKRVEREKKKTDFFSKMDFSNIER